MEKEKNEEDVMELEEELQNIRMLIDSLESCDTGKWNCNECDQLPKCLKFHEGVMKYLLTTIYNIKHDEKINQSDVLKDLKSITEKVGIKEQKKTESSMYS